MDKSEFRARLLNARYQRRDRESQEQREVRAAAIASALAATPAVATAVEHNATVASYISTPSEPPTDAVNSALTTAGARLLVPQHETNGQLLDGLQWIDLRTSEVAAATPDEFLALNVMIMIIPALAMGNDCSRLGKGKGYYDRFLSEVPRHPNGPMRIALVGPDEVFSAIPVDEHDQPMDSFIIG